MAIVSLDCPKCGAKLPPREETGRTTFETARAPHHAPPQEPHRAPPQVRTRPRRARSARRSA